MSRLILPNGQGGTPPPVPPVIQKLRECHASLQGMINVVIVLLKRQEADLPLTIQLHEFVAVDGYNLMTQQDPESGSVTLDLKTPDEKAKEAAENPPPPPKPDIRIVGADALKGIKS